MYLFKVYFSVILFDWLEVILVKERNFKQSTLNNQLQ